MASTIEKPTPQQYVDFDEYIDYQLQKTRGNIKTTDILTAFAFVAVFVLAYLLVFVICDHWLVADGFSQTTRVVLLSLVGLATGGWLVWKVLRPYLRQVNQLFAAKVIEQSQPELHSTLLNLIDARAAGKQVSPEILTAMEKRAAVSMSQTNVDEAVDRRPLMWACYAVLGLVVLFSLYTLMTPKKVSASIWRALFPASAVEAPTQTIVENVTPGDTEVIPGTRLEVLADIRGEIPEKVVLHYSTADREFVNEPLEMREVPDVPRRFRAEIIGANGEGIQQDLNYFIKAGDDRSETFTVKLFQPPSAEIVELHYSYPAYMERETKTRTTGNIDDYEGVAVTFLAQGNMPLRSATITFHDDQGTNFQAESLPMSAINKDRTRFRAMWVLGIRAEDGIYPRYYTIECKNDRGESDPNPTRWPIRIHPDQRPEVNIVNPTEREQERPANAIIPLTAAAKDDFKVKSLTLWKQWNDQKPIQHVRLFEGSEPTLSVGYDWKLEEGWTLNTGDKVSYWVEAQDNRTPTAGKRNTDKYTILIQPKQAEKEIQKQLQSDRPQPSEQDKNNEKSQKNQDQKNNNQRPQDQSTDPNTQPEENKPQENPPQEKQGEKKQGEKKQGEKKQGEESGTGNTGAEQDGSGTSQSQQKGNAGESVSNDGTQDDQALESLHKHLNKNQPGEQENPSPDNKNQNPQPGEQENKTNKGTETSPNNTPNQNQPNQKPDGTKPDETKPDGTKPDAKNPENKEPNTDPNNKQPGDTNTPKTGNEPSEKTPDPNMTEPGMEKGTEPNKTGPDKNNPPMPQGTEKTEPKQTPENKGTENKPKPNDTPADKKDPGEANTPPSETNNPDAKPPAGQENSGGSDQNEGEGTPSDSQKPVTSDKGTGTGGEETKPSDATSGRQADKPLEGTETPTSPDEKAEKRPATGDEKGPATTEKDPNADAKPAKNNLDREDPENPANTRKREGSPEELPNEKPTETQPDKTQPGSNNPNAVKPNDNTKKPGAESTNPDEQPAQTPENNPDRKPATNKERPNMGDDDLVGKGRPEGQEAKKPDGGEAGSSKENTQGTPGGNEKGPGDKTPRPGDQDPADKPNGKPGQEKGEGSTTRPTERTEEGNPRKGTPPDNADPQTRPNQSNQTPKEPGERGTPGQPGTEPSNRKPNGNAGPPEPGQNRSAEGPITPDQAQAAEEANLEYGREATDLALKKLEKEIERGEVNEKWLKEMGWDKADASKFLDRMKDRMNQRDVDTPEAVAKKHQFEEWLKRLNKPATNQVRRNGGNVKNEAAREVFNPGNTAPPPELRDLYEAYQRGVSEHPGNHCSNNNCRI